MRTDKVIKIIVNTLVGVMVLGSVLLLGFAFLVAASLVFNIDWQYLLMFAAFLLTAFAVGSTIERELND